MSHTIHCARSLNRWMSTYWEMGVSRTLSRIQARSYYSLPTTIDKIDKMELFGKIIVALIITIFAKHSILNLPGGSAYVGVLGVSGFWIFQDCEYAWVLNFQGYTWFTYMVPGSNYGRVLNIPGFQICQNSEYVSLIQCSAYAWIWMNNAWINCSNRSDYGRVLNTPVLNMSGFRIWHGLRICKGYKGYWICLNKSKYSLTMPAYAWICLENADYRLRKKKISAIWLAERSTILAKCVLCCQYLYSLTKQKKIQHSNSVAEKLKCIH